jgi:hypothetical protein
VRTVVSGSAANILSFNTSLSQDFNSAGFGVTNRDTFVGNARLHDSVRRGGSLPLADAFTLELLLDGYRFERV